MSNKSPSLRSAEKGFPPVHDEKLSQSEHQSEIDLAAEQRVIRKVDFRLIPILALLYGMALIDRTNLGLVRVAGMERALALNVGDRYTIVVVMFFIPYIIFELPANIYIRRTGVATFIGTISFLWGCITLAAGFVKTWNQLLAIRVLLGILEAGFFPACTYVISVWYTRREVQLRLSFFYQFSILLAGFSPIFSYGLSKMNGKGDVAGWSWIWIIEGLVTALLGIAAFWLVVDFPDKNKFLSQEQTQLVLKRIDRDRGDAEFDPLTVQKFWVYVRDLKLWGFCYCFLASTMPSYAISYFLPVILAGMGKNVRDSQLLCAPPYVVAVVWSIAMAFVSDKVNLRAPFLTFNCLLSIIGCCMISYAKGTNARYGGTFIALMGCTPNVPGVIAYQANNIVGQSKRAYASALTIMGGGVGGIIAACAYRQKDAPKYRPGILTTIFLQVGMILVLLVTSIHFHLKNKAVRGGSTKYNEGKAGFYYTL